HAADVHPHQPLIPPADDGTGAEREREGVRRIERQPLEVRFRRIVEPAAVVDRQRVARRGDSAAPERQVDLLERRRLRRRGRGVGARGGAQDDEDQGGEGGARHGDPKNTPGVRRDGGIRLAVQRAWYTGLVGAMILHQFYLNCLAHASYLVGDERTGTAAVVDPQRDIEQYLSFAQEHGLTIRHVLLTHLHADFVAGHLELRDRVGATIYLGRAAKTEYAFQPLGDGDRVEFGRVRLQALETPGHTPESISILVFDLDRDDTEPHAVLTGDTLFVGDVGRPDLRVSLGWAAADLGSLLYDSLWQKLLPLPDRSLVYPAHGAGSLCGKAIGRETVSTIGEQRRANYALQPMAKSEFIDIVTADQPEAPAYFVYDAVLNSQERPTLDEALARGLKAMTLEEALQAQASGAQLLDTRDPADFAAAHLKGSINIGLGGQYATWAGTVLSHDRPIVIL